MSGAGFFFAFALVAFPAACVALLGARRKVAVWLWLERQWEERKAVVMAKRKRSKAAPDQILLFPEAARPAVAPHQPHQPPQQIAVNDWSIRAPRKAVGS